MTLSQVYELLEMEGPEDFEYFEQLADLVECQEDIEFDILYTVLSQVTDADAGELVENYFDELTNALPDDENDIVSIIDSISQNLMLLAEDLDQGKVRVEFVHRIESFRNWFHKPDGAMVDGNPVSLFEAVTMLREDRLNGDHRSYNFENSCDYKLEDASMVLGGFEKIEI